MSPRIALAFVVTTVLAIGFIICGVVTVIASVRWAFGAATIEEFLRTTGIWLGSFALMQAWSFWLRWAKA